MKKSLFIFFIVFLAVTAPLFSKDRPTSQGVYRLSGSISGCYTKSKVGISDETTLALNIAPGFSYFFFDNFELGLQLGYYHYDRSYNSYGYNKYDFGINNHYFLFGASFRSYFPIKEIYPFIGAGFSLGTSVKYDDFISSLNMNTFTVLIGFDYFLSRNVSLEPALSYSYNDWARVDGTTQIMLGVGINYCIF